MRWMPISTAPRNGDDILVCCENQTGSSCVKWEGGKKKGGWVIENCMYSADYFTHWMPMPLALGEKPSLRVVK